MLGFPILYLKGVRIMMFQLSGFYSRQINVCSGRELKFRVLGLAAAWGLSNLNCPTTFLILTGPCTLRDPLRVPSSLWFLSDYHKVLGFRLQASVYPYSSAYIRSP